MAHFIFEPIDFFPAFEWDLRGIDGATHFLDKKSSGIIYMQIYIYIHNTNVCNLQYKQTKMIGNVENLVNNTLMSIYWSGSCAIYLFMFKSKLVIQYALFWGDVFPSIGSLTQAT